MKENKFFLIEEKKFYQLVDDLFIKIEDNLNIYNNKIDIDYEIQNYVLKIEFINKSVIIINRQESLQQIWLASMTNGYHFNYQEKKWICSRTNTNFWSIFQKEFAIQSQTHVDIIKKQTTK